MIHVEPISPVRATGRVGRTRTGGAFRMPEGMPEGESPSAAGLSPAAELDATLLVSLQEAVAPAMARRRDRAARARCDGLLAALGCLQRSWLLGETASSGALESLRRLVAEPPDAADPVLRALVAGTVTRARIEMARSNCC